MIQKLGRRDEQGSVLVVALAFLSLFGVFIAAILAQTSTNLHLTSTTRARTDRLFAADGGVEWGIQRARTSDTTCPTSTSTSTDTLTSTLNVDGRAVTVTCKALSGAVASPAAERWSVITGNLNVPGAGTPTIKGGDVWLGGTASGTTVSTSDADVVHPLASCAGYVPVASPAVTAPDTSTCSAPGTPDVAHVLPIAPLNGLLATPVTCNAVNDGLIWHPGKYISGTLPDPPLYNYLESGVYYFENVNVIWNAGIFVGGAPGGETSVLGLGCPAHPMTDTTIGPPYGAYGSGVTLILGGTSTLNIRVSAKAELYSRVPSAAEISSTPGTPITPGISVITVGATGSGYLKSTAATPVQLQSGAQEAIHGLVYSTGSVSLYTQATRAPLLGGVVASTLTINGPANGLAVEASGRRTLLLTSTAAPAAAGEIATTQSAVVKVANDVVRTASVRSWRAQ